MRAADVALIALLLSACGTPSTGPATTPSPATASVSVHDAGPPARILYQRGEIYTPSRADDDRFTCIGTPDLAAACQQVRPGHHCVLESPVAYWEGEPRCKGTRMTRHEEEQEWSRMESLTVPACECSCTDSFIRAADAFDERRKRCQNIP